MMDTYNIRVQLIEAHSVTFEDGHVDEGSDLWDMPEPSGGRLDSTAVLWLYVITAAPAGQRKFSLRRHRRHGGSEGQEDEEEAQHCCAYKTKHDRHLI